MQMESSSCRLNTFKESKKEINKIFSELLDYINDCNGFLRSIHESGAQFQALINADEVKSLSSLVEKVKDIQIVISRDNMKCVFFGRTSNGKSTAINAMLGDRILPAGMGHTTCCFLEIRGSKESQGSVSIISSSRPGSDSPLIERKQIDSVQELSQSVSANKLPTDSLIRIDWPSEKCALLSEDVVIIDSPGISNESEIDQCIDEYCRDADVFVLVVNSESTLDESEMAFFDKVRKKLCKPNLFILNNRWDASADEIEYVNDIRNQQLQKCVHFLTEKLQVCSKSEAEKRVFFVSAKEVLSERSKNKSESGVSTTRDSSGSNQLPEGWETRLAEFRAFEMILGKTLSESAAKTKFAAHSIEGQDIVRKVSCIMETLKKKTQELKNLALSIISEKRSSCENLVTNHIAARNKSTSDISSLSDKLSKMVTDKLEGEMWRLGDVINNFNQEFSEKPETLDKYKKDLNQCVERQLLNKMKVFCSGDLCKEVKEVDTINLRRYEALVQDKKVAKDIRQLVCEDYVPEFKIDLKEISSGFHEDLSFRFKGNISYMKVREDPITYFFSRFASFLSIELIRYLAQYVYEYWSWTKEAKEKAYKTQFASYIAEKLKPVIDRSSKHVVMKPEITLKCTLAILDKQIERQVKMLQEEIAQLERDIQRLHEIAAKSRNLKDKALGLEKVLKAFHNKYILV